MLFDKWSKNTAGVGGRYYESGRLLMTGGGALLKGFDRLVAEDEYEGVKLA